MAGTQLHADASFALRNDRIVEARHVYTLLLEFGSILLRKRSIVEHHGADGTLRRLDVEAGSHHLVAEVFYVFYQAVVDFVALAQHLERLDGSADDCGRNAVGEEIRTTALAQDVDNLLATCRETAHCTTKSLTERAGVDVYTAVSLEKFADAVTRCADNAG